MPHPSSAARAVCPGARARAAAASLLRLLPLVLAGALVASPAAAYEGPELSVTPLFGSDVAPSAGWSELLVTVENRSGTRFVGAVEAGAERHQPSTSARVDAPAHARVLVRLPVRTTQQGLLSVRLLSEAQVELTRQGLTTSPPTLPTMLLWGGGARLGADLRGTPLRSNASGSANLRIGTVQVDPSSGAPLLPDSAATYIGVDVMVLSSASLAQVQGAELTALTGWVLAGGSLAIVPKRPEHLQAPPVSTLLGGPVAPGPIGEELLPPVWSAGPRGLAPVSARGAGGPGPEVRERLVGFQGGNLHGGRFGSSAAYGLGEVHLLAFDPLSDAGAADPWVQARVLELATRGYERRALRAVPPAPIEGGATANRIARALDPNERFRGALALAALVLVLYAILAGPVVHILARRRRKPLEPLVRVPLLAAGAFALIVLIGLASRGFRGRARHIAFVEAGAGMQRGAGVAYRGFFASSTTPLALGSLGPGSRLSTLLDADGADPDHYSAGPAGLRLDNLSALPWQTVVVRESGFLYDLPGQIAVRRRPDGRLAVKNATGHALRDVLLTEAATSVYFARIEAGATVGEDDGRTLGARYRNTPEGYGGDLARRRLSPHLLREAIGGEEGARMEATWELAAELSAGGAFWRDESPVLIAELDAPRGASEDCGLRIESERVLLRIVGEGGAL